MTTVYDVARHFGVFIADRSCVGNNLYNGRSIANRGKRGLLSEHDLLHEIGHYVVASPTQRRLPEYGLIQLNIHGEGYADVHMCVSLDEGNIQECMATLLSVHWGKKYGFSHVLSAEHDFCESWDEYLQFKLDPANSTSNYTAHCNRWWETLIRLRQGGLLDGEV